MVLIEVEQSIKRYLLAHPEYFPAGVSISSMDDFDINLVDYFDCMSGVSSGGWTVMYLASRGGQGAFRAVLDDPTIVENYGSIPTGGAEGLRVFYKEFGSIIYPQETINTSTGMILDLTNPFAPGIAAPLYPAETLETALEVLYGDATLDDLDTSVLVPALDLLTGFSVFFVQNAFKSPPASSSAKLVPRTSPREFSNDVSRFHPDLVFEEGKNYYLKDVGAATGSVPVLNFAKSVTPVGSEVVDFLCIDGAVPVENAALPTSFFVASEAGLSGFQDIAILSLGAGQDITDFRPFANAGLAGWLDGFELIRLYTTSGLQSTSALLDYVYYANPNVKPHQYLRIQFAASDTTEEGMALSAIDQTLLLDVFEDIGVGVAEVHRRSIDAFVRDFIFG